GTLAAFFLVSLGVIVLRRSHPEWKRPFRVPAVPWLPGLAAASALWLASNLPRLTWIVFTGWLLLGLAIYLLYGRRHSRLARAAGGEEPAEPVRSGS
ncbi:MAG: amino acid permease C-terminal domain-containing protein, partial [Bacillota bacterium]|nr:amino acid permease C-terminal domain-containing protein [Bacillota bacterium]